MASSGGPNAISRQKLKDDNIILNICDCYKDSTGISSNNELFNTTVKTMFGRDKPASWLRTILALEEKYLSDVNKIEICWLKQMTQEEILKKGRPVYDKLIDFKKLPEEIEFTFQESGYSPQELLSGVQECLTMGSYIDPAPRKKINMIDSGNPTICKIKQTIGNDLLIQMGFGNILVFNNKQTGINGIYDNNKNIMTLTMNIVHSNGNYIFKTKRSDDFKHESLVVQFNKKSVTVSKDFFRGNLTKNKWFLENDVARQDNTIQLMSKMFVLCKELGDTLQVLCAKDIMGSKSSLKYCLFTVDNVVATRCAMLGVPVCVKDPSRKIYADLGKAYYYIGDDVINIAKTPRQRQLSELQKFKVALKLYYNQAIGQNNNNKISIENVIKYKRIFIGGTEYVFENEQPMPTSTTMLGYFQTLIDEINDANTKLTDFFNTFNKKESINEMISAIGILESFKSNSNKVKPTIFDLEKYCKTIMSCLTSVKLVDNLRILYSMESHFVYSESYKEQEFNNIIIFFIENKGITIGDQLINLAKTLNGVEIVNPYKKIYKPKKGGSTSNYEKSYTEEYFAVSRKCVNTVIESYNDKPDDMMYEEFIDDITYDFVCLSSVYMNYISCSTLEESILLPIIQSFLEERNITGSQQNFRESSLRLRTMTFEDFERFFYSIPIVTQEMDAQNMLTNDLINSNLTDEEIISKYNIFNNQERSNTVNTNNTYNDAYTELSDLNVQEIKTVNYSNNWYTRKRGYTNSLLINNRDYIKKQKYVMSPMTPNRSITITNSILETPPRRKITSRKRR